MKHIFIYDKEAISSKILRNLSLDFIANLNDEELLKELIIAHENQLLKRTHYILNYIIENKKIESFERTLPKILLNVAYSEILEII